MPSGKHSGLVNIKRIWVGHQEHLLQKLTTVLCESQALLGSLHNCPSPNT